MLTWFFIILFLAAALVAAALATRSYMSGTPIAGQFFGPKPEKRLAVVEQARVDNRRHLILVRRDGVEHLIMTGGPVDVVIETGIGAGRTRVAAPSVTQLEGDATAAQPVFSRQPRTFGQAVNE